MKSKTLIALSLTLLMFFTLAIPALAAGPRGGGAIFPQGEESGHGAYLLQVTPDNELKITIILRGAEPNQSYLGNLHFFVSDSWGFTVGAPLITDENGNCWYTRTSNPWAAVGPITFDMTLRISGPPDYTSTPITVTFNP